MVATPTRGAALYFQSFGWMDECVDVPARFTDGAIVRGLGEKTQDGRNGRQRMAVINLYTDLRYKVYAAIVYARQIGLTTAIVQINKPTINRLIDRSID